MEPVETIESRVGRLEVRVAAIEATEGFWSKAQAFLETNPKLMMALSGIIVAMATWLTHGAVNPAPIEQRQIEKKADTPFQPGTIKPKE